ncbi:hypothetical protein [Mesorhizobium sp. 113-3-3]|uniref:hypothetical protein n=1 Tax=Mesorhizobium sp. 113-3-3 TaxID=2744516 RepID=UPI00192636DC|nr:hypothetical protein [Mesorhizobium sp. 113-3-3]BCG76752.1 hypothetical protein MesoLj113b_02940 [Mesorhizobium sp. 113-3-3]
MSGRFSNIIQKTDEEVESATHAAVAERERKAKEAAEFTQKASDWLARNVVATLEQARAETADRLRVKIDSSGLGKDVPVVAFTIEPAKLRSGQSFYALPQTISVTPDGQVFIVSGKASIGTLVGNINAGDATLFDAALEKHIADTVRLAGPR